MSCHFFVSPRIAGYLKWRYPQTYMLAVILFGNPTPSPQGSAEKKRYLISTWPGEKVKLLGEFFSWVLRKPTGEEKKWSWILLDLRNLPHFCEADFLIVVRNTLGFIESKGRTYIPLARNEVAGPGLYKNYLGHHLRSFICSFEIQNLFDGIFWRYNDPPKEMNECHLKRDHFKGNIFFQPAFFFGYSLVFSKEYSLEYDFLVSWWNSWDGVGWIYPRTSCLKLQGNTRKYMMTTVAMTTTARTTMTTCLLWMVDILHHPRICKSSYQLTVSSIKSR